MKIGVIGAGQMGLSISVALSTYFDIVLLTREPDNSRKNVERQIRVASRLTDQNFDDAKILVSDDYYALSDEVSLVIEAVPEVIDIKHEVLRKIECKVDEKTIIASNTSTISITSLASVLELGDRFVGCHFFNPPYARKFIELIKGEDTREEVMRQISSWLRVAEFNVVEITETPGYIVNRAVFLMINEAIDIYSEKQIEASEIDGLFEGTLGHPMGPLKLADFIGLDTCLAILNNLYEEFKQEKFRPSYLLTKKVRAGKHGKKNGEGFYKYKR